jgi:hypothetical protein
MRPLGASLLLFLGMAACTPAEKPEPTTGPRTLTPHVEKSFAAGPKLLPAKELSKWLESQKDKALLRVPVTITRGDLTEPLRAKIGDLDVQLDTSALGMSLEERLSPTCPRGSSCRVLLEARYLGGGFLQVLWFSRALRSDEAGDVVEVER